MSNKTLGILAVIATVVLVLAVMQYGMNQSMVFPPGTTEITAQNSDQQEEEGNDTGMGGHSMDVKPVIPTPVATNIPLSDHGYAQNIIKPSESQPIKKFTLVAKEAALVIKEGLSMPVWTYNGSVPGTEIRVQQGDFVQVELRNELTDPVTIHWHGYPLLSAMDGVPGINQDSVRPGETFTYAFSADFAGTYWYHSHQEGAKQVDKGLYGALIVEPGDAPQVDKDFTLILDEWTESPMAEMEGMGSGEHGSVGMTENEDPVMAEEEMMSQSYNIYTVNGKSGRLIEPLRVQKGDKVRLRFINAGYRSHSIHLPVQDFQVVATDGQAIPDPGVINDRLVMISPGERYDLEFIINTEESFSIDAHDANPYNDQLKIPVHVTDGNGKAFHEVPGELPLFDLSSYGKPQSRGFSSSQEFSLDYRIVLNTRTDDSGLAYTLNGKTFAELPPFEMKSGDTVKLTFENRSQVDHPMHLHGHFFQLLEKNDQPVQSTIMKDTLLVRPGEKYTVAFKADNPGYWVQHCHELHHAAAGMMMKIVYTDFKPNYIADPNNIYNKPE